MKQLVFFLVFLMGQSQYDTERLHLNTSKKTNKLVAASTTEFVK